MEKSYRHPKPGSIDAQAAEILEILDQPDPQAAARNAAQAIAQARDAGDGVLRQQHLAEAQHHIARINPRDARTIQQLQGQVLALQGRGGDTRVVHVSPRELVIPHAMQTSDFMQMVAQHARLAGIDPRQLMVGNARASVNPRTGHQEFGVFFDDGTDPSNYLTDMTDGDGNPIQNVNVTAPSDSILSQEPDQPS